MNAASIEKSKRLQRVDDLLATGKKYSTLEIWNPFSKMPMEWKPLGKFIDADRSAAHAKAHAEDMYQRALKAEELLYRFYIDRDKKAEEAILNFVQDGLGA